MVCVDLHTYQSLSDMNCLILQNVLSLPGCNHWRDWLNIEYLWKHVLEKQENDGQPSWKTSMAWGKSRLHSWDLLRWSICLFSLLLEAMLTSSILSRITQTFTIFGWDHFFFEDTQQRGCRSISMGPKGCWSRWQIFGFQVTLFSFYIFV